MYDRAHPAVRAIIPTSVAGRTSLFRALCKVRTPCHSSCGSSELYRLFTQEVTINGGVMVPYISCQVCLYLRMASIHLSAASPLRHAVIVRLDEICLHPHTRLDCGGNKHSVSSAATPSRNCMECICDGSNAHHVVSEFCQASSRTRGPHPRRLLSALLRAVRRTPATNFLPSFHRFCWRVSIHFLAKMANRSYDLSEPPSSNFDRRTTTISTFWTEGQSVAGRSLRCGVVE
jgi:hypothetical protein